jgi:hypothetical protein
METTKLFFLYCIFSEQNDVRGEKKLGCTIHPVHRLQVYNTGDAPGSEKRYAGLWLVRANTHIDMRKLEKQLHRQFAHVRLKRSNGALTEWFRLSFQEVADFLNAQDHVIRQLSHEEIYDIHVKADRQLTVAEQAAYDEEEALIHAEKEQGSLKDVFFSTFLPDVVPRRIQVELWDTFSAICYSNHALFKGIVQWPTGTGKTIAILLMIVLIKDRCRRMGQIYRGLLVTPRNDIFGTITGIFSHLSAFGITVLDGSNGRLSRLSVPADTDILIMDEWMSVGDADFKVQAEERLREVIDNTGILILASHQPDLIERECNRVIELSHGAVVQDRPLGPIEPTIRLLSTG